jgi:PKD repeat protein
MFHLLDRSHVLRSVCVFSLFLLVAVLLGLISTASPAAQGVSFQPNLSSIPAQLAAAETSTGWSGDLSGSVNPISITMDANKFITATFTIVEATATITLSNLTQTYDGTPKPVTATTDPVGLSVVITYTGTGGTAWGPTTTAPTNAGTYQVDAAINEVNYQGSATGTLTVNKASTTASVTSAPNPSVFGQTITFTATVSSTPSASEGTVTFFDNGNLIGTNALVSGTATFSTSALSGGAHPITATYSGGTNFNGSSSGAITHTVNKADTTTSITSSTNPSYFGQTVTFTATVTISGTGAGTPTGVLTLTIDSTAITQTLCASGVVTYSTSALAIGVHPVAAAYSGNTNFSGSSQTLIGGQVVTDTAISGLTAVNSSPTRLTDATFFTATISAGSNVSYQWNFGDGQTGSGVTTTHSYTASGAYTAIVTATNSVGTHAATTTVYVAANPIAQAGPDQTTRTGKPVTLDGSASFDPGNFLPLTYQWQQTGGPAVILSGVNNVTATFTAPAITQTQVLTFALTVTNALSIASPPDVVVITVEPYHVMLPLVVRPDLRDIYSSWAVQFYDQLAAYNGFEYATAADVRWIRLRVSWFDIEPTNTTPENYQWSTLDQSLAAARDAKINLVVTLEGNPTWASNRSHGPVNNLNDFKQFAGALAARYPDVQYWEIYNEPDNILSFGNQPAAYAAHLNAAYTAIKTANPGAKIVMGGVAMDWFTDQGGSFARNFVNDMLAACTQPCFDVSNFHYYPVYRGKWEPYGRDIIGKANAFRQMLAAKGYNRPVMSTETGWTYSTIPGTDWGGEAIQGRYVPKSLVRGIAAGLITTNWYAMTDADPSQPGLLGGWHPSFQVRQAYTAIVKLSQQLGAAKYERALTFTETASPNLEGYVFTTRGVHGIERSISSGMIAQA